MAVRTYLRSTHAQLVYCLYHAVASSDTAGRLVGLPQHNELPMDGVIESKPVIITIAVRRLQGRTSNKAAVVKHLA